MVNFDRVGEEFEKIIIDEVSPYGYAVIEKITIYPDEDTGMKDARVYLDGRCGEETSDGKEVLWQVNFSFDFHICKTINFVKGMFYNFLLTAYEQISK